MHVFEAAGTPRCKLLAVAQRIVDGYIRVTTIHATVADDGLPKARLFYNGASLAILRLSLHESQADDARARILASFGRK